MSSIRRLFRQVRTAPSGSKTIKSAQHTGIHMRPNPATGDVGPDAPGNRRPPFDDRDRRRPRGGNRNLGGDVRTPLAP